MIFLTLFLRCFNPSKSAAITGFMITSFPLLFIASLVFPVIALIDIAVRHNKVKGIGWSIAVILISPLIFLFGTGTYVSQIRQERKKLETGLYNLELLGKALIGYAGDHNDYLPDANQWCDLLMEHNKKLTKENFRHPQPMIDGLKIHFDGQIQFAFNKYLSGKQLADIPGDVVLLFEADGDWNLAGGPELLQTRYRKDGYITMLFVDGTERDYWFYEKAVRKFGKNGTSMYYEQPRWQP